MFLLVCMFLFFALAVHLDVFLVPTPALSPSTWMVSVCLFVFSKTGPHYLALTVFEPTL